MDCGILFWAAARLLPKEVMMNSRKRIDPAARRRVAPPMQSVDELNGRELDAAVQREVMGSVVGWILMPNGKREPVFVRPAGENDSVSSQQPNWVPHYSTHSNQAAALDRRIKAIGLNNLYERNVQGAAARPEDKCRAALIAVRAARAIDRLRVLAS
jgi:hypothetical protein